MKRFFSIFLVIVMTSNLAVSYVEQLWGEAKYEYAEMGTDDADEDGKTEKEKEKESFAVSHFSVNSLMDAFPLENLKGSLIAKEDRLISGLYASLPELPPEA